MPVLENQETGEWLMFDGFESETISYPANVTDHPLENSKYVVDHIQQMPYTVEITGLISKNIFDRGPDPELGYGEQRHRLTRDYFERLKEDTLFTYISYSLGYFENLAVENVDLETNNDMSSVLNVSITLKHVVIGRTEEVELPPIIEPEQEIMLDAGETPAEEADEGALLRFGTWLNSGLFGEVDQDPPTPEGDELDDAPPEPPPPSGISDVPSVGAGSGGAV